MEAKSRWDGGFSLMCCLLTTEPVTSATGKSVPLQLIVIALKQQLLAGRHRQGAPGSWRYTHFGRSLSANDWYNLISEFQICVLHLDSQMRTYPWPVGSVFGVWTSWHLSNRKAWPSKQLVFWKLVVFDCSRQQQENCLTCLISRGNFDGQRLYIDWMLLLACHCLRMSLCLLLCFWKI